MFVILTSEKGVKALIAPPLSSVLAQDVTSRVVGDMSRVVGDMVMLCTVPNHCSRIPGSNH